MSSVDPLLRRPTFAIAFGVLRHCFDEAWQAIAGNYVNEKADAARYKLAALMLDLARDDELSPDQITQTAIRMMRDR